MLIATKSTVPVGTSEKVRNAAQEELDKRNVNIQFDVASNPEFLKEGAAIDDFLKPDRIVIGLESPRAEELMKTLYKPFTLNGHPLIFMDITSAEMTKYAANSYLATRISFMNEIANLCEKVGANVDMVRMGMGSDSRIGKRLLFPGVGYGGSCFPKDVQALARTATDIDYDFRILNAVMGVNDQQRYTLAEKIKAYFGQDLRGHTIGIWGLAFKPNTDDIREAPALYIIESLLAAGAKVKAFGPEAMNNIQRYFGDQIELCKDQYEVLINADALAIVTEWSLFRTPSFQVMKELMKQDVIFDGRNLYDLEAMAEHGFHYHSIGRESVGKKAMQYEKDI